MKKNIYLLLLAAFAVAITSGCESQGFETPKGGKVRSIAVKEAVFVSASQTMELSLKDNTELQLNVVTIPADAPVSFANRHPELLEVTPAGLLKPKAPGVDTLTVTATDGSGMSTNFVVNIINHLIPATAIDVAAAGANPEVKYGGKTFDLGQYVTVSPADAWEPRLTYTSSNTTYATVDPNTGVITSGNVEDVSVTITITYSNDFNSTTLTKNVPVKILGKVYRPVDISRTDWTVTTQTHNDYGYMWDGGSKASPVTGLPQHMFDESLGSYLSLIKPGGSSNGVAPPADSEAPSFIVDMKEAREFDYIKWGHRNGAYSNDNGSVGTNAYNYLRVYGVYLFGSNDGTTFTPISPAEPAGADAMVVWIPQKATYVGSATSTEDATYNIPVTRSTYRYVKVQLKVHGRSYGTGAGQFQHPDYPGGGTTSGQAMQISDFGAGVIVVE